jgi:hypothetical protein
MMKDQVVESIAMTERKGLGRLKFYRTPTMHRASFTAKDLLIFFIIINRFYLNPYVIMVALRRSLFSDCCFRRYQLPLPSTPSWTDALQQPTT